MAIDPRTMDNREEVYSFYGHDGSEYHLATARLLKALLANPDSKYILKSVQMPEGFDELLIRMNGAELDRLDTLTAKDLKVPCIVLDMGDKSSAVQGGTHMLADGTHRAIKLYRQGKRSLRAYVVPQEIWELFLIAIHTGPLPLEVLHKHTGNMLLHRKRDA